MCARDANGMRLIAAAPATNGAASHSRPSRREGPLPGEEGRQEREHEEAEVADVELRQLLVHLHPHAEQLRDLDGHGGGDRQGDRHQGFLAVGPGPCAVVGRDDEPLPEPLRVLPGKLAGECIKLSDALHGDEERLVLREPRLHECARLAAKVILELVRVHGVDRRPPPEVRAPLGDTFLQRDARPFLGVFDFLRHESASLKHQFNLI